MTKITPRALLCFAPSVYTSWSQATGFSKLHSVIIFSIATVFANGWQLLTEVIVSSVPIAEASSSPGQHWTVCISEDDLKQRICSKRPPVSQRMFFPCWSTFKAFDKTGPVAWNEQRSGPSELNLLPDNYGTISCLCCRWTLPEKTWGCCQSYRQPVGATLICGWTNPTKLDDSCLERSKLQYLSFLGMDGRLNFSRSKVYFEIKTTKIN